MESSSGAALSERKTKQKRDPAWNYCQLYKNDNGKKELKCAFCGKVFKGGGIHRVKEHLAGAKGDGGSPCLNVNPDVRSLMQDNLSGIMGKRSKKPRFVSVNEMPSEYNPNDGDEMSIAEDSVKPEMVIDVPMDIEEGKPSEVGDADVLEPVPIGSYKRDAAWRFCQMYRTSGEKPVLECIYCKKVFLGGGIYRLKEHLAGRTGNGAVCPKVPTEVRLNMQQNLNASTSAGKQNKILRPYVDASNNNAEVRSLTNGRDSNNDMDLSNDKNVGIVYPRLGNNQVQMAIGRFMLYAGLPFDAVNSVHFQRMSEAIASQKYHVVPPSNNDLRSWVLECALKEVKCDVDRFTGCWGRTGCSILVDERITGKGRIFLNVLVNCPEGPLFFKSIAVSDSVDDLYRVLANVTEEVGVSNVLQVITSGEKKYIEIGERLERVYPIFWTPCASHCVSLILEDFRRLDWISAVLEQCQSIARFIYNEHVVLNMMRKHTLGVDLIDIGATQQATDFMTLNRMVRIKQNLETMVASEDWTESTYSKGQEGLALFECFTSESFWDSCALITRLTEPFLRLLRIVSSEKRPAMGYVYGGIFKAKEMIKKELINQQDYFVYWDIIDQRSKQLQHHPLLAAGFYLNPKYFYSIGVEVPHIKSLLFDCVEKLVPDNVQDEIGKETPAYKNGEGDFGRKMAVRARDTYHPAEWWSTYGGACPNLSHFAFRVLSQTCSLVSSKPSHINLDQYHETANCLEQERLGNHISVQYNWWLRERVSKNKNQEPLDPLMFTDSEIADCWLNKDKSHSNTLSARDWSAVSPPLANVMLLGSEADDYEALRAGFEDPEVFNVRKDIEPEADDTLVCTSGEN